MAAVAPSSAAFDALCSIFHVVLDNLGRTHSPRRASRDAVRRGEAATAPPTPLPALSEELTAETKHDLTSLADRILFARLGEQEEPTDVVGYLLQCYKRASAECRQARFLLAAHAGVSRRLRVTCSTAARVGGSSRPAHAESCLSDLPTLPCPSNP